MYVNMAAENQSSQLSKLNLLFVPCELEELPLYSTETQGDFFPSVLSVTRTNTKLKPTTHQQNLKCHSTNQFSYQVEMYISSMPEVL